MDKQREAFEAWYSNWTSSNWEPSFGEVWDAACEWQAALSHAEGFARNTPNPKNPTGFKMGDWFKLGNSPFVVIGEDDSYLYSVHPYTGGWLGVFKQEPNLNTLEHIPHPAPQVAAAWGEMLEEAVKFAPTAPAGEPAEIPEIGSQWRHRNGNVYTVESITNGETERPGQYPVTIVYRGGNGKLWSRPAHDWHRSMTLESTPVAQQLVSDPDEREIAALREDAERYHFLISIFGANDDDLYNAIDGAMPAEVRNDKRQPTKAEMDIALDAARLRAGKEV